MSRTRRDNIATLKPTTPLHTPNKGPLKPPSPLHPKTALKRSFLTRKGDGGFNPTRVPASKGDDGFRQPGHLVDRARLRRPRAAAGPGRTTSRRAEPHISNPAPQVWRAPEDTRGPGCVAHGQQQLHRHPNVARNLSWSLFATLRKRCNSNAMNSMFELVEGELRAELLVDSHSWASGRRTEPYASTPGPTGVEGAGGTGGHGRASRRGAERSEAA